MMSTLPLRRRVALAFMALGFILSTLFAAAAIFITEDYEHVIASEILHGQADDYALRTANHLPATLPQTQRLSGYRMDDPALPRQRATLKPGVHEDPDNDGVHIGVFDTAVGRLMFEIDLSDIERLEQHLNMFLAALIILGTAVATWLGWLLAGSALKPVRTLAAHVDALPVTPAPSHLADNTANDEVGQLARAIDGYQARLVEADAREQTFFADASHELRSPLSVIQGVVDVMRDSPSASPSAQARVQRLERGVRDMRHLLEAMLSTARRAPLMTEAIPAETFLRSAGEEALAGKQDIRLQVNASGDLMAAAQEARLLILGLAQKLVQAHVSGQLTLTLAPDRLDMAFDDGSCSPSEAAQSARADTGTGSALMDRLAVRQGWQVAFSDATHIRVQLK